MSASVSIGFASKRNAQTDVPVTGYDPLPVTAGQQYATVAASQTKQALGATGGAVGDLLGELIIVPGTTSPGVVNIFDGSGSAISVFAGGSTSVPGVGPIVVELGINSTSGAWQVTTGANVTVIATGRFT